MKQLLSFIIVCLTSACAKNPMQKERDYEEIAYEVVLQTAKELKKKYKLSFIGEGGQMMHEIKCLYIDFEYSTLLDVDEARPLVTEATKTFLRNINSNEEIRPFLTKYPFTPENVNVTIFFSDRKGNRPPLGDLLVVYAKQGSITYLADKDGINLIELKVEPFPPLDNSQVEVW